MTMRARGFSLIELIIAIVVLSIIAAMGAPLLANGLQFFNAATTDLDTLSKQRYATERMVRELRAIRFNAGTNRYDVTLGGAGATTSISFTKVDGVTVTLNGAMPPNLNITYSSGGAAALLTDQLAGVAFTGFTIDGVTTTTDPALMKYVDVDLTLQRSPTSTFARIARVQLRNQDPTP